MARTSAVFIAPSDHRNRRHPITVRVIEFRLKDVPGAEPIYRLITAMLDPRSVPARELAALYHERWEIETTLDELKTPLRGCPERPAKQDSGTGLSSAPLGSLILGASLEGARHMESQKIMRLPIKNVAVRLGSTVPRGNKAMCFGGRTS